ncbi:MAG: signal peptidase II [Melioribacteraceae bacterium]|nr:signal peptidase II [Melioribacteraceae bacterium]MDD3557452.1 signal peptidase II [Melioribacteraceae bacterium]
MRVLFLSLLIVIADQLTKLYIKGISIPFLNINFDGMRYGQSKEVFGDFLKITFVENPGMAFGIEVGDSKLFLSLFSLVASIGILIYLYKVRKGHLLFRISLALILAGAVGNLIDRTFYGVIYGYAPLFYGKVVDFFNVDFFDFSLFGRTYERWPIFNIADSAVTIGVLSLIFFNRLFEKRELELKKEELENESNEEIELEEEVIHEDDFGKSSRRTKFIDEKEDDEDNNRKDI